MRYRHMPTIGPVRVTKYSSLPTFDTEYDPGRVIYITSNSTLYYGVTEWVPLSSSTSGTAGIDYLEVKPSEINLDSVTLDELFGGIVPCLRFDSSTNGTCFFDFLTPNTWYSNVDIKIKLLSVLLNGLIDKTIYLKTEIWNVSNGNNFENNPDYSFYDSITSEAINSFDTITLSASIPFSESTFAVKITRIASHSLDTFEGTLNVIKVVIEQDLFGTSNDYKVDQTQVINKASDYAIPTSESECTFTNVGATSTVTFTLPLATSGMRVKIDKINEQPVRIIPASNNYINDDPLAVVTDSYLKNISYLFTGIAANKWTYSSNSTTTQSSGDRGVFASGGDTTIGYTNIIDYISISILSNALDFGDLPIATECSGGMSNDNLNRGLVAGGLLSGSGSPVANMNYFTITTLGNGINFGNLTRTIFYPGCTSNGLNDRGLIAGGYLTTVVDYITMSTISNATVFGQLTLARYTPAAISNGINNRAVFGGGNTGSASNNTIDYLTITTTGNAIDFGDLLVAREGHQACSNHIINKAVFQNGRSSGAISNIIDYVTISTLSNAASFGILSTTQRTFGNSTSNGVGNRGIFAGGFNLSSVVFNNIDYINILYNSDSVDFGDLTVVRWTLGTMSNSF